jgi:hypothetical protein
MKYGTPGSYVKSPAAYEKWYKFRKISSFFLPSSVKCYRYMEDRRKAKTGQKPIKNEEKQKY